MVENVQEHHDVVLFPIKKTMEGSKKIGAIIL
jgi:hypothetical protein